MEGNGPDQRPGRQCAEDHRDDVDHLVDLGQPLEVRREGDGQQETEKDLHARLRDPDLLDELLPLPVGTLLDGLAPPVPSTLALALVHDTSFCPLLGLRACPTRRYREGYPDGDVRETFTRPRSRGVRLPLPGPLGIELGPGEQGQIGQPEPHQEDHDAGQ